MDRQNVLTPDPNNSGLLARGGRGAQPGLRADGAGAALSELRILAGYVYADAVVTKDNVLPVGALT